MLFSTLPFIYIFMPAVLLTYFLVPRKFRNAVLLIFSLIFYIYGERTYIAIVFFSIATDFIFGLKIEKHRETNPKLAKRYMVASIITNLLLLGFFKYVDFFIGAFNLIPGLDIGLTGVRLPIGISFFTFQTMSYSVDVYRGDVKAQRNLINFATFVSMFPQKVAGPVVRYSHVAKELEDRRETIAMFAQGVRRFCIGLGKKVLIADNMGLLAQIFRDSNENSVMFYWLYAFAFFFQIYFDFSAYSDMAIGLGKMFGFEMPENFNFPYIARSITDFWRRWHMTLGTWFRDYVYIPLGGNRVGQWRWIYNVIVVWALTGFWHGADWNFILWGLMMAALLLLERFAIGKLLKKWRIFSHAYVIIMIVFSFVIFNAEGMSGMVSDLGGMLGLNGNELVGPEAIYYLRSFGVVFIVAILGSTPMFKKWGDKLLANRSRLTMLEPVMMAAILLLTTAAMVDGSFSPFLYFRF